MPRPSTATNAPRRRRRVATLLAASTALLGCAATAVPAAAATNTTTTWYSIDQLPANTSSPSQFLTATSTGQVTLARYSSGEWRQQWNARLPRMADVTGRHRQQPHH